MPAFATSLKSAALQEFRQLFGVLRTNRADWENAGTSARDRLNRAIAIIWLARGGVPVAGGAGLAAGGHDGAHVAGRCHAHAAVGEAQDAVERKLVELDAALEHADGLVHLGFAAVRDCLGDDAVRGGAQLQEHLGDAFGVEAPEPAFRDALLDDPREHQRKESAAAATLMRW